MRWYAFYLAPRDTYARECLAAEGVFTRTNRSRKRFTQHIFKSVLDFCEAFQRESASFKEWSHMPGCVSISDNSVVFTVLSMHESTKTSFVDFQVVLLSETHPLFNLIQMQDLFDVILRENLAPSLQRNINRDLYFYTKKQFHETLTV